MVEVRYFQLNHSAVRYWQYIMILYCDHVGHMQGGLTQCDCDSDSAVVVSHGIAYDDDPSTVPPAGLPHTVVVLKVSTWCSITSSTDYTLPTG